tara:strand:- start:281 stop:475 length:195 start_codon:yes stop_codon:yes gene_type:complete
MPSNVGYQPPPIQPKDFDKFLDYQYRLNQVIRGTLHEVKPIRIDQERLSMDKNNGERRNGNRRK